MDKHSVYQFIKSLGVDPDLLASSFLGALTSLRKRKGLNFVESVLTVFFGFICSLFITPLFLDLFSINSEYQYSVAFLIGYGGLVTLELMINWFHGFIGKH